MKCIKWSLVTLLCLVFEAGAADFGVKYGQMTDCRDLNREILRNWLTLQDHLAPYYEPEVVTKKNGKKKVLRPNRRDLQCLSPAYMQGLHEVSSRGSLRLRCFSHPNQEAGYCCDKEMTSCAMYVPK